MDEPKTLGAIEAGGTKFVCALTDAAGTVLEQTKLETHASDDTFARMNSFFEQTAEAHGTPAAFGIASFGPIDIDPASPDYGRFLRTPKPSWQGARYGDALGHFGVPMMIETDVNGAGLGEWAKGAGQGCDTLAYVTVGTGIGGGVLQNGVPLNGFGHFEMGHIRVSHDRARDPYAGRCPFHGDCLEGLAAGPAILDRWKSDLSKLGPQHGGLLLEADYLAQLTSTIVLFHMPDRIILGGGVMKTPGLMQAVRSRTSALLAGYVAGDRLEGDLTDYIVPPALGDDAGLTGAIMLAQRAAAEAS
ncbi:MAG: fructokinase [Sphingorhabdus sp.]|nr:fructokinase [Sphingorhabdus sp.]